MPPANEGQIRLAKPGRPRRRWRSQRYVITGEEVDWARKLLGIVAPVELRLTRYSYDTYGV
jgi:hypothetical protein